MLVSLGRRHAQLTSVVAGLYEEVNKLTLKWPTALTTNLTVEKTNRAVTAVRDFLAGPAGEFLGEQDDFAQEIHPIITAGDLPENRDVLLTLSELRQALSRVQTSIERAGDELRRAEKARETKDKPADQFSELLELSSFGSSRVSE